MAFLGTVGFSLHMRCTLETFSTILTVHLAWHCAVHAPAFRCDWEIFVTLEAGTSAVSRAWNFFPCGIHVIWFCIFVALPHGLEQPLLSVIEHVDQIRGGGTQLMTTAMKGGSIGETRPFTS